MPRPSGTVLMETSKFDFCIAVKTKLGRMFSPGELTECCRMFENGKTVDECVTEFSKPKSRKKHRGPLNVD
jgi:hypothetical protein